MVKLDGFWQNSVQSIITVVLEHVTLKPSGIVSITMSLVDHIGTQPNLKKIKFAHVMMYLEAADLDKLKSQAVCFSGEPNLNHDKKKRNDWSTPASLCRVPGFEFDANDEKLGEDKTSDLSPSLSSEPIETVIAKL